MSREQKMLAVVEAMREAVRCWRQGEPWDAVKSALFHGERALLDLDAHTEADAETVTLAVWRGPNGTVTLVEPRTAADQPYQVGDRRLGTVTLPITREGGR